MARDRIRETVNDGKNFAKGVALIALVGAGIAKCSGPAVTYTSDALQRGAYDARPVVQRAVGGSETWFGDGAQRALDVASTPVTGNVLGYVLVGAAAFAGIGYLTKEKPKKE